VINHLFHKIWWRRCRYRSAFSSLQNWSSSSLSIYRYPEFHLNKNASCQFLERSVRRSRNECGKTQTKML